MPKTITYRKTDQLRTRQKDLANPRVTKTRTMGDRSKKKKSVYKRGGVSGSVASLGTTHTDSNSDGSVDKIEKTRRPQSLANASNNMVANRGYRGAPFATGSPAAIQALRDTAPESSTMPAVTGKNVATANDEITLSTYFTDADNDTFTYTITIGGVAGVLTSAVEAGGVLTLDYGSAIGTATVTVDAEANGVSAPSQIFNVTTTPIYVANTKSVDFDGLDDEADVANHASLNADYISVAAWVKIREAGDQQFLRKNNAYTMSVRDDPPVLHGAVTSGYWAWRTSGAEISLDTWTHVAMTYDGTTLRFYVNGDAEGTNTVASGVIASNASALVIGHGDGSSYVNGNMDEVAVWGAALTAENVAAVYNSGNSGGDTIDLSSDSGDYDKSGNLAAWWRMGDGDTYDILSDNSANSNHATMANMTSGDIVTEVVS